jgi:hypothetical protein
LFFRTAFDNRTKSAREIWRQMQATRYHKANPKLKINTEVLGTAAAPEVVFKFIDDTEVSLYVYASVCVCTFRCASSCFALRYIAFTYRCFGRRCLVAVVFPYKPLSDTRSQFVLIQPVVYRSTLYTPQITETIRQPQLYS